VLPVYVAQRDMFLLGGDVARDTIKVRSGPYRDQRITRVTPVAAWLHQFGKDDMVGAFIAPIYSQETLNDQPWSISGFAGVIGMHWQSDTLQWFYGGIYEQSFGEEAAYPYFGLQWAPTPQWVLALLFPWPTISYTPANHWLLQVGIAPGGSSWISRGDGFESTQTFGSWNLNAGVAYQLEGPWWLYAGAGLTGLRGLTHTVSGDETWFEAQSSPVYTVAIQFRP
jgi:opacity protein-like surface antigen